MEIKRTQHQRTLNVILLTLMVILIASGVFLATPAKAHAASGWANVGGHWMSGGQSYFSVNILDTQATGYCLNPTAAEPMPGMYPYTADVSESGSGGTTAMSISGSSGQATFDPVTGLSKSQTIAFWAGTSNANWSFTVPAKCVLHKSDGSTINAGASATIANGQSFYLTTDDAAGAGDSAGVTSVSGSAHADASYTTTYTNIVITPPDATDGVSRDEWGRLYGYQRVGISRIDIAHPNSRWEQFGFSVTWNSTVDYYVDGESTPCATQRVAIGSPFAASAEVNAAALKPNCARLDAWYSNRRCTDSMTDKNLIQGPTKVYGKNKCSVGFGYAEGSLNPALVNFYKTASAAAAGDVNFVYQSNPFALPSSYETDWGSMNHLPAQTGIPAYYLKDGQVKLTTGLAWYPTSIPLGSTVKEAQINQNSMFYLYCSGQSREGIASY